MITFSELQLKNELLQAVEKLGYVNPTPVQEQAIPQILSSANDVIALAQTGTGKTAAFGLPILEQISLKNKKVQSIILCPTRELCLQITRDLQDFCVNMKGVKIQPVYGGADAMKQIRGLKDNPQIVVGTPGRTLDLIKRKALKIEDISWLVLDEADEMLNMGFREDIDEILATTPKEKQTLLFSATMPKEVRRIASEYMHKPIEISIGKTNASSNDVEHQYFMIKASDRYLALKRLADIHPNIYAIVFCRTRRETQEVANKLMQDGYNADSLHGDLSQAQRDTVMDKFRRGQLQLLVATDVAARGIDVNELTHVINYNLPDDPEVYVHRSGRTGRAGNKGVSMIIAHSRENRRIRDLEKLINKPITLQKVPTGNEIVEKRLYASIDKIENIEVDDKKIEPYMEEITKKLAWIDKEGLLKRLVAAEFNTFVEYYKNAKDLNASASAKDDRGGRKSDDNFTRFFINIGEKHKIKVPNLIGLINEKTKNRNIDIGKIEILRNFSFFEVENEYQDLVLSTMNNTEHNGDSLTVEISKKEKSSGGGYSGKRRSSNSGGGKKSFGGGGGGRRKSFSSKSSSGGYNDRSKRKPKRRR